MVWGLLCHFTKTNICNRKYTLRGKLWSIKKHTLSFSVISTKRCCFVSFSYVVKIEPKENGPLFVEMHFYIKASLRRDFSYLCFGFFYIRGASHSCKFRFFLILYLIPLLHLPLLKFPLCRRMLGLNPELLQVCIGRQTLSSTSLIHACL